MNINWTTLWTSFAWQAIEFIIGASRLLGPVGAAVGISMTLIRYNFHTEDKEGERSKMLLKVAGYIVAAFVLYNLRAFLNAIGINESGPF